MYNPKALEEYEETARTLKLRVYIFMPHKRIIAECKGQARAQELPEQLMRFREKNRSEVRKTPNMTVARDKNTSDFVAPLSTMRKSPWPSGVDNEASWDGDSRATSASWAEDMEEVGTRKVLDLWKIVERVLYKEDKEDENLVQGSLMEECIQWRMQIPHFRVIGEKMRIEVVDENGQVMSEKELEEMQERNEGSGNDGRSKSNLSKRNRDIRDKIIERLVDFIMEEVEKDEPTSKSPVELNDVLRITPAPTYSGRETVKSRDLINDSVSNRSANRVKSFELTERMSNNNSKAFKKLSNNAKSKLIDDNNEDEDDLSSIDTTQLGRNKLGTVFNKKIVVSPMAFAVTTRESFCTLKTTPIKYAGHLLELTTPRGFNRDMSSASKINSAKRSIMFKGPQRHSAWQAPVCPSAWPKNVRLAPIDPSRLSSSKNRSLTSLSPSVPQRQRNSLSPIPRPLKVTSADTSTDNLEIQGKQITQSAKPNLTKNGWDNSRNQRRKKS